MLHARCLLSPQENHGQPALSLKTGDEKVLAGAEASVSWNRPCSDFTLSYYDPFKSDESSRGWEAVTVIASTSQNAVLEVPALYYDTLWLRFVDEANADTGITSAQLRYFIFNTAPQSDTTFQVGDTIPLAWEISPLLSSAILMLNYDNGRQLGYITGFSSISYPDTSFTWVIGNSGESDISYPASGCRIMIAEYNNQDFYDVTSGRFDIVESR
jgi:hypothetical protein